MNGNYGDSGQHPSGRPEGPGGGAPRDRQRPRREPTAPPPTANQPPARPIAEPELSPPPPDSPNIQARLPTHTRQPPCGDRRGWWVAGGPANHLDVRRLRGKGRGRAPREVDARDVTVGGCGVVLPPGFARSPVGPPSQPLWQPVGLPPTSSPRCTGLAP